MVEGEKVLVLGRHGKHKNNILTPKAKKEAYEVGKSLRKKYHKNDNPIDITDCFVLHSGQQRTIDAGKSILSGIFGRFPDYKQLKRGKIPITPLIRRSSLLGYEDIEYNEEALYEKYEENEYMKIWTANPDLTDFEGQHVTCYNEMLRRGKACLVDTIDEMIQDPWRLGMLITHMSITEPIFMAGVNSARKTPCTLDDIGGIFETGECVELVFKPNKEYTYNEIESIKKNEVEGVKLIDLYSKGKFIRREKSYDVDLTNLLSICEE